MEPVTQDEVIREWLSLEAEKEGFQDVDVDANKRRNEEFARLLVNKPESARVFQTFDLEWYHHELTEAEFRSLRRIWDGHDLIFETAREIANDRSSLPADKIDRIRAISNLFPNEIDGPLIITRRRWIRSGPFLQDGNHRAIGLALHMLRDGDYVPQSAYVGYPTPITGIRRKIRGTFHRVINRL